MILQRFLQDYKKNLLNPDLWLDCLSAWLLSVGAILAFDQLFRFHAGLGEILLFPAFLIVLLAVLTRKDWLLPALVLGIGCLYVGLLSASGELEGRLEYLFGFLKWWMALFPIRSIYNTAENIQLVMHVIQLIIVCIVFFCVRILRSVTAMSLMSMLMFAVIIAGGFRQNIGAMTFMAIGLFPLIARNFAAAQDRPAARRKRPRIQRLTPSWSPRIAAVALCGAVSLLAMALLPGNTAHWTSAGMRQLATRIQRATSIGSESNLHLFQPAELDRLGLMPNLRRLGGPISGQSRSTVLKLYAEQPLLMRGTAYDTYTGSSWETSWDDKKAGLYAYDDVANEAQKRLAFGLDLPLADVNLYSQVVRNADVRVDIYQNSTNLYTVGRTESLQMDTGGTDLYFNRRGEVFARTNMRAPILYKMSVRLFSRSTATERSELAYIASKAAQDADPQYEAIVEQYTKLPPKLPERVRQTAVDITLGVAEPYKIAEALETYLSSHYRYTLTPSDVPSGRDFVEYFLETGEGYCVYFASAMAVMARTLGIPARMVCGYGVKSAGYQTWIATGTEAHAWVECYFKGLGWIEFDPTAGSSFLRLAEGSGTSPGGETTSVDTTTSSGGTTSTTQADGTTTTRITTLPGETTTSTNGAAVTTGDADSDVGAPDMGLLWLILGIVGGVLLLALALVWRILACAKRYRLDIVRQKRKRTGEQAEYYYADYLRQLHLLGYDPRTNETMKQFAGRILEESGDAGRAVPDTAREVFLMMMDWRYGEQEPSPEKVERLAALHEELEQLVKKGIPAAVYFVRRTLMLGG